MSTYTIPIDRHHEALVTIADRSGPWGVNASSIAFNSDADIVAETTTTTYCGYCAAEIIHQEIAAMIPNVSDERIAHLLESRGLECECDEEDDDEED